jgi:hypothetical protein
MGEYAAGRFQFGAGIVCTSIPFNNLVRRYAVYYSPGGNQFGGDVTEPHSGNYITLSIPVRAEFFFAQLNKWRFGVTVQGEAARFVRMHHREYFDYTAPLSQRFVFCSTGPAFEYTLSSLLLTVRPQVVMKVVQERNFFGRFGGMCEFSIGYKFGPRPAKTG